jgi:hypothetical protein
MGKRKNVKSSWGNVSHQVSRQSIYANTTNTVPQIALRQLSLSFHFPLHLLHLPRFEWHRHRATSTRHWHLQPLFKINQRIHRCHPTGRKHVPHRVCIFQPLGVHFIFQGECNSACCSCHRM